jgi:hypothetical protein
LKKNIAISVESAYFDASIFEFNELKLVLTHPLSPKEWTSSKGNFEVIEQHSLISKPLGEGVLSDLLYKYPEVYFHFNLFMSDYDTRHVFERKKSSNSLMEQDTIISDVFYKSYHSLIEFKIDVLIVHDTPHSLVDYTFSKCADYLGIKIFNIRRSFLPWRAIIFEGLWHKSNPLKMAFGGPTPNEMKMVQSYQNILKADYDVAMPDYERKKYEVNKGRVWSWKKEFNWWGKKSYDPRFLYSIIKKRQVFLEMKSLSKKPDVGEKYVSFYLHYQPERTTCPEGGVFNSQFIAVQLLRSILPIEIAIYVREHPSSFRNTLNLKVRYPGYYRSINAMNNVFIGCLDQNSFEFLDESLLCATITGTIGFEAINRNKKCIYFGDAGFKGCPGTYHISEFLKNNNLMAEVLSSIDESLEVRVAEFVRASLVYSHGDIYEGQSYTDYTLFQSNWIESLIMFLSHITNQSKKQ